MWPVIGKTWEIGNPRAGEKCGMGSWTEKNRQAGQGQPIWKAEGVGRRAGDPRKRKEECVEQDWKWQGRRLAQETTGDEELGQGRRGCRAGTVPIGENPRVLGEANDTDEHTGKGVFLY